MDKTPNIIGTQDEIYRSHFPRYMICDAVPSGIHCSIDIICVKGGREAD
jgi:hypothetical protein